MSQETRDSLVPKRSVIKRRVTNLIKKLDPLTQKQETTQFDIVCAEQYLNELRNLDSQFQEVYLSANSLIDLTDQELLAKDYEEIDSHDDRIRENVSKLLFLLNTQVASTKPPHETKSSDSKGKKITERKWNRITANINNLVKRIEEAHAEPQENDIEDLVDIRSQISECEKCLDRFASEIDSTSPDLDDPDGDNWNDLMASYFDMIKLNQEKLSLLIKQHRRNQLQQARELEVEK